MHPQYVKKMLRIRKKWGAILVCVVDLCFTIEVNRKISIFLGNVFQLYRHSVSGIENIPRDFLPLDMLFQLR